MRNDNYPSASEMVRNLSDIKVKWTLLHTEGKFRVVQFERPYYEGGEFWVVNEKGFMWESVDSIEAGREYLGSEEAQEYQAKSP